MKITLKTTLIATAIAAIPYGSHAAGLGAINVFSGLGQPLKAEIELSATPQELQALTAKVASVEAYRQANLSYSPLMTGLRLSVEPRGERSVVKVVSDRPVNDPYLDLVVEISWATGRLNRGYTFLLDPVDVGSPTRPTRASVSAPAATKSAPSPQRSALSMQPGEYKVKRGDTLLGIAARYVSDGANLDQMLIAILRKNPAAFDEGNINRLRSGAILAIPDEAAVRMLGTSEARREVVAQAADFNAYRKRLAGAVAARPAEVDSGATQQSSGTIAPRVDPVSAPDTQDRVEVSGSGGASGDRTRLARIETLEEELVAREKALTEANSRLEELEKTVRDLQRLAEMRNDGLAQLQQQATAATSDQSAAPAELETFSPSEDMTAAVPTTPEAATAETETETTFSTPEESAAPIATELAPSQVDAAPVTEPAPAVVTPPPEPTPVPPVSVPAPPREEPSFLDTLLEDPLLLGGGGILLLALAYAGVQARRRRQAQDALGALSAMSEYPSEAQSNFGVKGGQSVDTGNSSILHSDFSQTGLAAIDADEGVDPVAEADVYMAYGRDVQAEEILLDALKTDVSRGAIYLKLLEIYAARKNVRQFESVATDFYSRTDGAGSDWEKAATMGRALDPENPLYKNDGTADVGMNPPTEPGMAAPSGEVAEDTASAKVVPNDKAVFNEAPHFEAPAAAGNVDDPKSNPGDSNVGFEPVVTVAAGKADAKFEDTWAAPSQSDDEAADTAMENAARAEADKQQPASVESDFAVLDFDLGFDVEPAAASTDGKKSEVVVETASSSNFSLDTSTETLLKSNDAQEGMSATVINNDAFYQDFDGDAEPESTAGTGGSLDGQEDSLDATVFNNDLLNFEFDADSLPADDPLASTPSVDLSDIDLDLDLSEETAPEIRDGAEKSLSDTVDEDSDTADNDAVKEPDAEQEADTKLDLARAYEEMGDKEGARELVEEVLREGNTEQLTAAKALMERLG